MHVDLTKTGFWNSKAFLFRSEIVGIFFEELGDVGSCTETLNHIVHEAPEFFFGKITLKVLQYLRDFLSTFLHFRRVNGLKFLYKSVCQGCFIFVIQSICRT